MILPRLQSNQECPAEKVLPRLSGACQADSNPRPSPRFKTTSSPMTTRRALPAEDQAARKRRCRDALTLAPRHELHLAKVPVSTSGSGSSAGASVRPRPSAAQLLAAKNTRPIKPLGDLAADIFSPTRNWRNPGLQLRRALPQPCLTARGAAAHPLLDTGVAPALHRRKPAGPLPTRLIGRRAQRAPDSADERKLQHREQAGDRVQPVSVEGKVFG
jgi:hypothetical protein